MSLSSDGAPMLTMPVAPTNSGGNGGFGWDGNGSWFIIILFLFAFLRRNYRWYKSLAISCGTSILLFLLFTKGFATPLPVNMFGF